MDNINKNEDYHNGYDDAMIGLAQKQGKSKYYDTGYTNGKETKDIIHMAGASLTVTIENEK